MSQNNKTSFFRMLLNTIYNGASALEKASASLEKGANSLNEMAEVAHQKSVTYAAVHKEMTEKEHEARIAELKLKYAKAKMDRAKDERALLAQLKTQNTIDGEIITEKRPRPLAITEN